MDVAYYYGFWDASDVGTIAEDVLNDLAEDTAWVVNARNDIVIGWVNNMDHNGIAYPDGIDPDTGNFAPFAACAVTAAGVDWPHDSIAMHETSHLFDADDQGTWWWEHPSCIMNYYWAWRGVDWWCDSCELVVANNIYPP
jgi:hypothetical protein